MTQADRADPDLLRGTTLRVYRYLFRFGGPASIRDIQRGLALSSPSVAEYHVKKLLESGLVREEVEGYVVDRRVWQNMIRMKRALFPIQLIYAIFLTAAVVAMVAFFRSEPEHGYVFGLTIMLVALGFTLYEAGKALRWQV
jgi:DNA-binding transcriptional ArsR family regulator